MRARGEVITEILPLRYYGIVCSRQILPSTQLAASSIMVLPTVDRPAPLSTPPAHGDDEASDGLQRLLSAMVREFVTRQLVRNSGRSHSRRIRFAVGRNTAGIPRAEPKTHTANQVE